MLKRSKIRTLFEEDKNVQTGLTTVLSCLLIRLAFYCIS